MKGGGGLRLLDPLDRDECSSSSEVKFRDTLRIDFQRRMIKWQGGGEKSLRRPFFFFFFSFFVSFVIGVRSRMFVREDVHFSRKEKRECIYIYKWIRMDVLWKWCNPVWFYSSRWEEVRKHLEFFEFSFGRKFFFKNLVLHALIRHSKSLLFFSFKHRAYIVFGRAWERLSHFRVIHRRGGVNIKLVEKDPPFFSSKRGEKN